MADQTNPFTMAGMMGMMMPNPYTQYKGQLPIPGYMGTPTDAQGKPIQSFLDAQSQHDAWDKANPAQPPGTTLNSAPQTGNAAYFQTGPGSMALGSQMAPQGSSPGVQALYGRNFAGMVGGPSRNFQTGLPGTGQDSAGAGGGGAAATNPVDMRQAYLTALSNPGKVTTPGATVPEAQPLGQPSVLNSFLAAHPSGGTAPPAGGGYGNKGFFDTLNQLRSA